AQSRVAKARQELADGIQNGLLIKVRTALVEEALMTTVIRDGEPMEDGKCIMVSEHERKPPAPEPEKSAEVEKAAEAHSPGGLDLQAIIKAGQGLPGYEKSTCAWDLQLRRDVAELLSLHQMGGFISPSRKQAKKKEPHAPSAADPSDD
ncbi:MAG: hypothetical protein ACK55Z_13020, partial [bacterium]